MQVLYNCKHCKVGRKVDYPEKSSVVGYYRVTSDENGKRKCFTAGIYISASGGGLPTIYDGDTELGFCPNCHKMMSYSAISGHFNESVPCDGRCINARRGDCECSCGGKNHGSAWC